MSARRISRSSAGQQVKRTGASGDGPAGDKPALVNPPVPRPQSRSRSRAESNARSPARSRGRSALEEKSSPSSKSSRPRKPARRAKGRRAEGSHRWPRRVWLGLGILLLLALLPPAASWAWVESRAAGRITADLDRVRPSGTALVLGTSPGSRDHPNLYFEHRMDAAAALLHAGKVRTLLVSGDNRDAHYNEVAAMRRALTARGVPAAAIQGDAAGLRTLDSVLRARAIFQRDELLIVSQHFHAARAIAIARHHGIPARGFAAADVPAPLQLRTLVREVGARMKMVWELYLAPAAPGAAQPTAEPAIEPEAVATNSHG